MRVFEASAPRMRFVRDRRPLRVSLRVVRDTYARDTHCARLGTFLATPGQWRLLANSPQPLKRKRML